MSFDQIKNMKRLFLHVLAVKAIALTTNHGHATASDLTKLWGENIPYSISDKIMGIEDLHLKKATGFGVKAAVFDVPGGLSQAAQYDLSSVTLLDGSHHGSGHSRKITLRISAKNHPSVSPDGHILHQVSKKWEGSNNIDQHCLRLKYTYRLIDSLEIFTCHAQAGEEISVVSEQGKVIGFNDNLGSYFDARTYPELDKIKIGPGINNTPHDIYLTDVHLWNVPEDEEFAAYFENFITVGIKIVNLSRDFLFGPETESVLERFSESGGIIIQAAGNANFSWNKDGLLIPSGHDLYKNPQERIVCLDVHLHKRVRENPLLTKAFIFVELLDDNGQLSKNCCLAGDNTPERFIAAYGGQVKNSIGQTTYSGGTSTAAASITGIIMDLHGAFPNVSPQEIAAVLLRTTTQIEGTQGRGKVNAMNAYAALGSVAKKLVG